MTPLTRGRVLRDSQRTHFARGDLYFRQGRVRRIEAREVGNDLLLSSAVDGSRLYQQTIHIGQRGAGRIEGQCSCPVGYNCKHVVAACLAHIAASAAQGRGGSQVGPAAVLQDWLLQLRQVSETPADEAQPSHKDFVAYVMAPGAGPQGHARSLEVELRLTHKRSNGPGLTKGRKRRWEGVDYDYDFLEAATGRDRSIIATLKAARGPFGGVEIAGPAGALALGQLIRTSRLFWQDLDSPLQAGNMRPAQLRWEHDSSGCYQLRPAIEPQALLLATDPPWYLDLPAGEIGPLDLGDIAPAQWQVLLAAPTLTQELARELSAQLDSGLDLPLPAPVRLAREQLHGAAPRPRLRLLGVPLETGERLHAVELSFSYADHRIDPRPTAAVSRVRKGERLLEIQRDLAAEQEAAQMLSDAGLTLIDSTQGPLPFVAQAENLSFSGLIWQQLLDDTLPQLREQGWQIVQDESFALRFHEAELDGGLDAGQDWFALHFDLDIGGQKVPLAPLIAPFIDALLALPEAQWPERLSLPVGEAEFISLPAARLRPTLAVLRELYDPEDLAENALRRSRFDAAPLAALDDARISAGGRQLVALARKLADFSGIEAAPPPAGLQGQLRGYQQQGLNWLQFLRAYGFGGILADDMGLGKTLQTLAHLLREKEQGRLTKPALIVAPTSLMANWRNEAKRFTPDLKVVVMQGAERHQRRAQVEHADLILSTYPLLSRDAQALRAQAWSWLVLDEAQNVKNPRTKAARLIRELKTDHRLCLTGTPLENHLGELWAQFDFLMPGFLGDARQFKLRYRTPIEQHGEPEAREELARRVAPFMLRRTKDAVATELPAKTEIVRAASFGAAQAQLYESIRIAMDKRVREAIAKQGLARSHITILDALLKLRQTCCDPRLLKLAQAGQVKESAKLEMLMELLPELLEEGRRVLLFSQFTQMLGLIEGELTQRGIRYSKLTGQTRKREEAIAQFRGGEVDLFLISLKAGGVGLNLPEADAVILYDPWWNPAVETQAADRAHRIGQNKPVFVYRLLVENSVEETIVGMQDKKRALAEAIYRGQAQRGEALFDADSLRALFAPVGES